MSKTVKRIAVPVPKPPSSPSTASPVAAPAPAAAPVAGKLPKLTKDFLFAGRAVFTVDNGKGEHFTFRVRRKEMVWNDKPSVVFFLNVKTSALSPGTRAYKGYSYVGIVNADGTIKTTHKSVFLPGSKEYDVAKWATTTVVKGKMIPTSYEIQHAGKCGRCGKKLTDPESIKRGIGPDCWEAMGH